MNRTEYRRYLPQSVVNRGNRQPIRLCMRKAMAGRPLTLGFLGGSITQGSLASSPEKRYVSLVCDWWKHAFPQSRVTCLNAGIGGTTSQFGVARVQEDLLSSQPDLVVVEFSVNDDPTDFYEETYEGLVRALQESTLSPALLLLHNVRYDNGVSAEEQHSAIGKAYHLPCVSMKPCLYRAVLDGAVEAADISPDGLHPNDFGHRLVADTVIHCLEEIRLDVWNNESPDPLPPPVTQNRYQHSRRMQSRSCMPESTGFEADRRKREGVWDCFQGGWSAAGPGASIVFQARGTGFAVQYRKTVKHPALTACAVLDGDEAHAVRLDGNFNETWGDCLAIANIASGLPDKAHRLEIRTMEPGQEHAAGFYLASVIVSE